MRRIAVTLAAIVAGVLVATSAAHSESALNEITVSTSNALVTSATQPYELRFFSNDTATFDGSVKGRLGHYEATASFDAARALGDSAHLCERKGGIPLTRFATFTTQTVGATVLVSAGCANKHRTFTNESGDDIAPLATSLLKLASKFDWQYTGPARRDNIIIYAH
jgi:hypothetical protein